MIIVPTIPSHFEGFEIQEEQMFINKYIQNSDYIKTLCDQGLSWSGIKEGKVIIMAGVIEPHEHIGMVWAMLSKGSEKHLVSITRSISRWLDGWDTKRLETAVRHDFKSGHKWADMLGFTNETPNGMKAYGIDGETYDLYARVK